MGATSDINRQVTNNWLQRSFLLKDPEGESYFNREARLMRVYSTAMTKFTDTSVGGNSAINPLFQAGIWTDPPPLHASESPLSLNKSHGMGCFYSEMFDDTQQVIAMRFGVPSFNSITTFYGNFYNSDAGELARTGRGSLITKVFNAGAEVAKGAIKVMAWPLLATSMINEGFRYFTNRPSSQFYYLKPTMPMYWKSVQNILNHIATNMGITLPNYKGGEVPTAQDTLAGVTGSGAYQGLKNEIPGLVTQEGVIDIYKVAGRAQRKANEMDKMFTNLGASDIGSVFDQLFRIYWMASAEGPPSIESGTDFSKAVAAWDALPMIKKLRDDNMDKIKDSADAGNASFFEQERADGTAFAFFRVNSVTSVTESFSNDVRETDVAQTINNKSSDARSAYVSFSGGNVGDGLIASAIETAVTGVKDIAKGAMDMIGLSGVETLFGSAYVDIPYFWDKSSVQFPSKSYTIDLVSPYGDPYSRLINLYIPLSMLLAAALPMATGKHSFTSPFILEVYDKGRAQTRLGLVKSLTVQRGGSGTVSWNTRQEPLSIRVTLDIMDLANVMHMPITENWSLSSTVITTARQAGEMISGGVGSGDSSVIEAAFKGGFFDEDNAFTDYMAVLGSTPLRAQIYAFAKLKRKWYKNMADSSTSASIGRTWMGLMDNPVGEIIKSTSFGNRSL